RAAMTTAFARIAAAAAAALAQAPALSPIVEVARMRVLPQQGGSALVVRPGVAKRDSGVGSGTPGLWTSAMHLECYARGSASAPAADALDALLGAAVQRLLQDPALAAQVGSLELDAIEWDYDVDGQQTACATCTFIV